MSWIDAMRSLVRERTGVALGAGSPELARVVPRQLARLGLGGPDAYVARLAHGSIADDAWQGLLAGLLNGQTWFFRHAPQLEALADALEERAAGPLDVWCAACSTGEEAYSIAMILESRGLPGRVLATDLSASALAIAREGLYDDASLRALAPSERARWFRPREGRHEVVPELRARVTFRVHNLLDEPPPGPGGGWSGIICRNALIYFEPERAEQTVHRLVAALGADAVLVLGPSEALAIDPALRAREVRGQIVFGPAITRPRASPPAHPSPLPLLRRPPPSPPVDMTDEDAARRLRSALDRARAGAEEDAITDLRAVLFLEPACWQASYLLASLLRQRGEIGEAGTLYEHTLRVLAGSVRAARTIPIPSEHDVAPDQVRDACRRMLSNLGPGASTR